MKLLIRLQNHKTFCMLNSDEHEIYLANKHLNAIICWYFNIQDKFHA